MKTSSLLQVSCCSLDPHFFFDTHIKAKSNTSTFFHLGSIFRITRFLFFCDLEKLIHVFCFFQNRPLQCPWLSSLLCQKCRIESRFSTVVRLLSSAGNMDASRSCLGLRNFINGSQQTSTLLSTSSIPVVNLPFSPASRSACCLMASQHLECGSCTTPKHEGIMYHSLCVRVLWTR